ncbi:unnamed protein product, partial [Discosporangium mesarthrocarpum]
VQEAAKDWILSQPRSKLMTETPDYLYATSLSFIFGFPDSFGVKVFKNAAGKTEVWVQSELRIGEGDLNVNLRRTEAFLEHLNKAVN